MRGRGKGNLGLVARAVALRAGACALALACVGLPARAQEPLATPSGWEAGVQLSDYRYEEPGTMTLEGTRFGLSGASPPRPARTARSRVSKDAGATASSNTRVRA
jgi:hypothetical protein